MIITFGRWRQNHSNASKMLSAGVVGPNGCHCQVNDVTGAWLNFTQATRRRDVTGDVKCKPKQISKIKVLSILRFCFVHYSVVLDVELL